MMGLMVLLVSFAALLRLAYLESPAYERNRRINDLVKESKRNERRREHSPKRGYAHACAGWSVNHDGFSDF